MGVRCPLRCPSVCLSMCAFERRGIGPKRPLSGPPAPTPQGSRQRPFLRLACEHWGRRTGGFRVAQVLPGKGGFLFPIPWPCRIPSPSHVLPHSFASFLRPLHPARPAPQRRPARRGAWSPFRSYSDTKFCLSNRQEARSARKHCAARYQIRKNLWITFPHSGVWGCKKTSPGAGFCGRGGAV